MISTKFSANTNKIVLKEVTISTFFKFTIEIHKKCRSCSAIRTPASKRFPRNVSGILSRCMPLAHLPLVVLSHNDGDAAGNLIGRL